MTNRKVLLTGVLVALLLAAVVSFYASSSPDGLEKVATDQGISQNAKDHSLSDSPFANYGTKGVDDARLSTGLAGIAGVAITLALGSGLVLAVRRRDHDHA
jgi:cobalt/nickel transport system permease protein